MMISDPAWALTRVAIHLSLAMTNQMVLRRRDIAVRVSFTDAQKPRPSRI
jgi:hypothetical protein